MISDKLWIVSQGEDFYVCTSLEELDKVVREWQAEFPEQGDITVYHASKGYTLRREENWVRHN